MTPSKLSSDLHVFLVPGGLFDVEPCELDLNVGKLVRFHDNPHYGTIYKTLHKIIGVQKNYRGQTCYRVESLEHEGDQGIGRVAHPEEVYFVEG